MNKLRICLTEKVGEPCTTLEYEGDNFVSISKDGSINVWDVDNHISFYLGNINEYEDVSIYNY